MKAIVSKTIILAALAAFTLTGCKVEEETPVEKEATFELEQSSVTVPAEGGEMSVGYVAENVPEGEIPVAVYEADWIDSYDASEEGVITFTVAQNTDTTERSCDVRLTLAGVERTLSMLQEPGENEEEPDDPVEEGDFAVTIDAVGEASVTVSVDPGDHAGMYVIMVFSKDEYTSVGGTEESVFEALIAEFRAAADELSYSLMDYLVNFEILSSGQDTRMIELLEPDTDHVVFVAGMDYEGNHTEGYATKEFRTNPVEYNDMTFTIYADAVLNDGRLSTQLYVAVREAGEYSLTVWLVEDGIHWEQSGSGGGDYVHDWVIRSSLTAVLGDKLLTDSGSASISAQTVCGAFYSIDLPENVLVEENAYLVAFVTRPGGYQSGNVSGVFYSDCGPLVDNVLAFPIAM